MNLFRKIKQIIEPEYEPYLLEFKGVNIDMLNPDVKIRDIMETKIEQTYYLESQNEIPVVLS